MAQDDIAGATGADLARYRYGIVLALTVVAVMFSILAPDTPLGRGVSVALQGAMLLGVVATSREPGPVRRAAAVAVLAALLTLGLLVWLVEIPRWIGTAFSAIAVFAVLAVLTRGVVRLISDRGVTPPAVAGALTSYLLIGLLFALIVRFIVNVGTGHYFAETSGHSTQSEEIYFSFTTLTTTGYGDLTPATNVGRMLSVLEMLTGQIYLVTVIGLLIGNLRRARMQQPEG